MSVEIDVNDYARESLTNAVQEFDDDPTALLHCVRFPEHGPASFFRISGTNSLHIVGAGPIVAQCRRLVAEGAVPGWRLHPARASHTPLADVNREMERVTGSARIGNVLARVGFRTIEEVEATPDDCLLNLPNSGPRSVQRLRQFIEQCTITHLLGDGTLSTHAKNVLLDCAKRLERGGVVALCGFPASGKSTASRFLATLAGAIVFDKDTFAPGLEQAVMTRLTSNPYDRDSEIYQSVVAPHLYDALIRAGFTAATRTPVVLDAPFLGSIQTTAKVGGRLSRHLRRTAAAPSHLPVTTLWLEATPHDIRTRMTARAAERDQPKLADWDTYQATVLESDLPKAARSVVDLVIAN